MAARHRVRWIEEKRKLDEAVSDACQGKSPLGGDYWQAERRARRMYFAAVELAEILGEG